VIAETLQPGDRIDDSMAEMSTLLKRQNADVAAENFLILRTMKSFSADQRNAVEAVLVHACSAEELRGLYEAIRQPVAGEAMTQRAQLFSTLFEGTDKVSTVRQDYAKLAEMLSGEDFTTLALPCAGLTTLLRKQGRRNALQAVGDMLDWGRALQKETAAAHPRTPTQTRPLTEILMSVAHYMFLGADPDRAKDSARLEEERRRKEAAGVSGARIERNEEEVIVGRLKIPVRK